jgi:ABC-type transport system involved in cytochrome bd biosynthesis fused ATPase/permease subunit
MKKNMNLTDRVLRLITAAIIIVLYVTGHLTGTLSIILLALAGMFIMTSFISFCPLYALFGLNTGNTKTKP